MSSVGFRCLIVGLAAALLLLTADPSPAVSRLEAPPAPSLEEPPSEVPSSEAPFFPPTEAEPFAANGAMKAWVQRALPRRSGRPETRLRRLAALMLAPDGLALREVGITTTAAEAFERREGNCVSFAFLFVSLARELGIPAYFVLSVAPEGSRQSGDLRISDTHMAAAFGAADGITVFDFGGKSRDGSSFRPISDAVARAIFESNRGAEELLRGRHDSAEHFLSRAVRRAPELSLAWVNLGVARRRLGDSQGAEKAFREAIHREPENLPAWRNLALLLESRDRVASTRVGASSSEAPTWNTETGALEERPTNSPGASPFASAFGWPQTAP